ncbi:MAG: L-threonylcarbamoyladenylate synthase [Clostridia bacterium]
MNRGKDINIASKCILNGDIVVFPTETVYGIGANCFNIEAVNKIFKAKNRPNDNPLIVHISDFNMLNKVACDINYLEQKLIDKFMPGPISVILNKTDDIPLCVTGNLPTVAVRMPSSDIARKFIAMCDTPIAAPSANVSTKPSGTSIDEIYEELNNNVAYFLEDEKCDIGIESTVVKVIDNTIHILRPGYITCEDLKCITDNVVYDNKTIISPGMKYKHYSPNTKCILVTDDYISKINNLDNNIKIAVMVEEKNIDKLIKKDNMYIINLGFSYSDIAKNLFKYLRDLDNLDIDVCYIQELKNEGIGVALMNRIIKACEYNSI